jgi:hypothetical protein
VDSSSNSELDQVLSTSSADLKFWMEGALSNSEMLDHESGTSPLLGTVTPGDGMACWGEFAEVSSGDGDRSGEYLGCTGISWELVGALSENSATSSEI